MSPKNYVLNLTQIFADVITETNLDDISTGWGAPTAEQINAAIKAKNPDYNSTYAGVSYITKTAIVKPDGHYYLGDPIDLTFTVS